MEDKGARYKSRHLKSGLSESMEDSGVGITHRSQLRLRFLHTHISYLWPRG